MNYWPAESWGYCTSTRGGMTPYKRDVDAFDRITRFASGSAVVIFCMRGCPMCHTVMRLFCGVGVNPTLYELDQDPSGKEIERMLVRVLGTNSPGGVAVPVVFVGGKLVGATDRVMATHINGSLVPLLKEAGALWL